MSHTKQTPILNYTTANLPVGVASGTVVFNTDENCLNYYNGEEWISSSDWNSTYTTVSSNSANWGPAGLPEATSTVYVTKDGDDTYDGFSITQAKDTISAAITVASSLITGGATAVNIEILDSSDYSENINLGDGMILNGPTATLKGTITTDASSTTHVILKEQQSVTTLTDLVNPGSGGTMFYKANRVTVSSSCRAIHAEILGTYIYADIDTIEVGGGSFGLVAGGGLLFAQVKYIELVGPVATGIASIGSGAVSATVEWISEFGPQNAIGIDCQAGSVDVDTKNLGVGSTSGRAYKVTSGTLKLTAIRLVGNTQGTPTFLFTENNYNNDNWDSTYTTVGSESADWDSTYTTVSSNSAIWNQAGNYDHTLIETTSANWDSTYTTVSSNSADWSNHFDSSLIENTSANWDSTYTTVSSNSAIWSDHFDSSLIETTSATWDSTYTTVSSNSADWVKYNDTFILNDPTSYPGWVVDEDNFISNSNIRVPTQQSVKFYVDNIVTGVNSLKGGYDASTDTPELTAGVGVLQGDTYYVTVSGNFYDTQIVDPGDLIIATTDSANLSSEWVVVNRNIEDELIDRWNSTYTTVSAQSGDWDSTYTTVGDLSAIWGEAAGTEFGPDNNSNPAVTQLALNIKERGTSYTQHENIVQGNLRGASAVDLQIHRQLADQVAAGPRSVLIGGERNKVSTNSSSSTITGGYLNAINLSNYSTIVGGRNNIINMSQSVATGGYCEINHIDSFMFNNNTVWPTVSANTFNVKALNGMRLEFDTTPIPGQVLTCLESNGISKWASLSADEWNSTYTTVSANSATWDITYTTVGSNSATWDTTTVYTVSTLPSAIGAAGSRAFVSDSDVTHAAGVGTQVVNNGSGAEFVPVYSNGSIWLIG
tara:strand:+ start:552 stop:3200 length:2649 start_codon:yes stop_codon:yes gene_type:complete